MAKVTTQENPGLRGGQGAGMLNVSLILEKPQSEEGRSEGVFEDLPRLLDPARVRLNFIQAVPEVSDSSWFQRQPDTYLETIVRRQQEILQSAQRFTQRLKDAQFQVEQDGIGVMSDEGCRRILDDLHQTPTDLLVIATRVNPEHREDISSFSVFLATHAPCPVLILRRPLAGGDKIHALMATDGTEASTKAAHRLPELLPPENLRVEVVTVQSPDYLENAIFAPYVNTTAIDEALTENAGLILNIARDILESRGVEVFGTRRLLGSPGWELVHHAKEVNPDLVVVGSHNRTGFPAWLLGSVSSRLVHSDPHSILVVR